MTSQAMSIDASQKWAGNDGQWSTFAITAGTPPKTLFVLPSTSGRSTLVVLPDGCTASDNATSDCETNRGLLFNPQLSTSWQRQGSSPYYQIPFQPEQPLNAILPANLTYADTSAEVGLDSIGFGYNGENMLQGQFIAAFAAKTPFLGQLGLSPVNESAILYGPENTHFSVLGTLNNSNTIPSAYWAYTAGASYRNSYGSLTFGGYDSLRGNVDNVVAVNMTGEADRDLVLTIQNIFLKNDSQPFPIRDMAPVQIFIDSTVPEIWLPETVCGAFEDAFGLTWNETLKLYLVDENLSNNLASEQASVTFALAQDGNGPATNITLPYAAFNLTAGYPLTRNNDRTVTYNYFPLRRAQDDTQLYLGRTFLQEAYIAADYDKHVFYVSPATHTTSGQQQIVSVYSRPKGSSGLSGGAIAGIVIGALVALAIAAGLLWWFFFRKRKGKKRSRKSTVGTSSIGGTTIEAWNDDVQVPQVEQYKPPAEVSAEESDQFKPELDATFTARGAPIERHELWGGHVRRVSDQSRASISPLEERNRNSRMVHSRTVSDQSFGQPSPPMSDRPSPPLAGTDSPFGHPSPPIGRSTPVPGGEHDDRSWFGPPVFELHGRSRGSPRSPTSPVQRQDDVPTEQNALLDRPEGQNT